MGEESVEPERQAVGPVPMKTTTVRFGNELWAMLEQEAEKEGISAAQFVRDAALLRLGALAGRRCDPEVLITIAELAAAVPPDRPRPVNVLSDPDRLACLARTRLLDAPSADSLDRLTRTVQRVLDVPVALVSLVTDERQFFTSQSGLGEPWASARQTPLTHSFCQYVVIDGAALVVDDAREHPVLCDNRAVPDLGVIAYAGSPLMLDGPHAIGALCAIDHRPRRWQSEQLELLADLSRVAADEIRHHSLA